MDERTSGIVLRTRPLTETSLIVHWLTPDLGRVATVAKGARRPKSTFRGKLDLFYEADFSFGRSRKSELHNLREVVLRETHSALRQDLGWIQQASYAATLLEQTTETETPVPELFDLMQSFLRQLTATPPAATTVFAFELRLLHHLGLAPQLSDTSLSEGARKLAGWLAEAPWDGLQRLRASELQTRELRQFLHGFLIYHIERIPAGRTAALNAADENVR
jgi:DNA repair protein RecO (recombination protein O)